MKTAITIYFFFGLVLATKAQNIQKIIDGENATIAEYPYIVSLYGIYGKLKCGGSILSVNWVLTAAHCRGVQFFVYGQTERSTSMSLPRNIIKFIEHPQFDMKTYTNDIAVLQVKDPIVLGPNAKIVILPNLGERIASGSKIVVLGWGRTSYATIDQAKILQKATLSVLTPDECKNLIPKNYAYNKFCIRSNSSIAFSGDSGGPVLLGEGKLIGVIITVSNANLPNVTNTATDVSYFREWIDEITALDFSH